MRMAREAMRDFIATQPAKVREALSCLGNGGGPRVIDCAGQIITNAALGGCLELASGNPGQHGAARITRCHGGPKQRWQRVMNGNAFALKAMANGDCLDASAGAEGASARLHQAPCTGAESQLFTLRSELNVTHLVAKGSGQCIAADAADAKAPAVVHVACAPDSSQQWHLQRSIFGDPPRLQSLQPDY
jgi:hypothetical protein